MTDAIQACREIFEAKHRGGPLQFHRDDGEYTEYYSSATQHEFANALEFFGHGVEFTNQQILAAWRAVFAKHGETNK